MATKPMPHPNEDADNLAARASKEAFAAMVAEARNNPNASGRLKAQQVHELYAQHVTEIRQAYERVTARRQARLAELESLVPVGPGIPEGTSPADRAVLMTAFRAALDSARNADRKGLQALLADAERYGDDSMRRAVLTHAMDTGEVGIVQSWTDRNTDQAGAMNEVAQLRGVLDGHGHGSRWDYKDFNPVAVPQEALDWPRIADNPNAQPGDNGVVDRPGVVTYQR